MAKTALLALADGSVFYGESVGAPVCVRGEVVFNTAMSGYQEIITDPSYRRQLVTLTYPHIGNVGVNPDDEESCGPQLAGLIVRDMTRVPSNWRSRESLPGYLRRHGVPAIARIDTRKLTRLIRDKGTQKACLMSGPEINAERALEEARAFAGLEGAELAREAGTRDVYQWREPSWQGARPDFSRFHVVVYDFGTKNNILRKLVDRGCQVTVVPADYRAADTLGLEPDGVVLANGPGDPEPCGYAIDAARELMAQKAPLLGICLGHQLMALASGAQTIKMKLGHHGANHPVLDIQRGTVMITSQNHGFAVDESSLPSHLHATHRSLFDASLQGIARSDCPAIGFQGHPEASPGPHDVDALFDRFVHMMRQQGSRVNQADA